MKLHYIWRHSRSFLLVIIKDRLYKDMLLYLFKYLFMILYLFIYSIIYLLEVMLLDWKLNEKELFTYSSKVVYFQKVFLASDMEYFISPSIFCQFNVYNILEEPGRMFFPGTLELSIFMSKLLVSMWHTLTYNRPSWEFLIHKFLGFSA